MTNKLSTRNTKFLFAGICIVIILATVLPVVGQSNMYSIGAHTPVSSVSGSDVSNPSTTSSDRSYCVGLGYLYKTSPSLNGGMGICQFPDGTWCDAHELFEGNCGPAPLFLNRLYGGSTYYVHTVYGDVPVRVLPDGRVIESDYGGVDGWSYNAYAWLHAP